MYVLRIKYINLAKI